MDAFLNNLNSPSWWIGVVVVGILINIGGYYLRKKLDSTLSRMSSWWGKRSESRRLNREKQIEYLRKNPHEKVPYALKQNVTISLSIVMMLSGFFLIVFAIGLHTALPKEPTVGLSTKWKTTIDIFTIFLLAFGSLSFLLPLRIAINALNQMIILRDAEGGKEMQSLKITRIDAKPEYTTDVNIGYKSKVRIILQNDGEQAFDINGGYWIANGNVSLELPERLAFRTWTDTNKWSNEGSKINVRPHQKFSTWIGLHEKLDENRFNQVNESKNFGNLALKIDGYDEEEKIRI